MNWILRILASVIFLNCCGHTAVCQSEMRKADKLLEVQKFQEAIDLYQSVISKFPENQNAHLKLAETFRLNNQLDLSAKSFELAEKLGEIPSESNLLYGHVLMGLGDYNDALKQYSYYGRDYEKKSLVMLEKCRYAIEHNKDTPHFKVDHEYVNTSKRDFGPEFFNDELVYLSNRSDIKSKSKFKPDVNIELLKTTRDKNGYLKFPKRMKSLTGTEFNVISIAYSDKMKLVAVTKGGEFDNIHLTSQEKCTLYIGRYDNHGFVQDLKPYEFNLTDYSTGFASFSEDGNSMYFSSDRPGGKGGFDIYKSELIGNEWSAPIHLSQDINSEGNEITPRKIGEALFFASDYHPGFGGYDIFKSIINRNRYGSAVNLGTAMNSSFDDYGMIYNNNHQFGYLVSNRQEGKGLEDLYRFKMIDDFLIQENPIAQKVEKEIVGDYSILKGMIISTADYLPIEDVRISATKADESLKIESTSNQKGLFSIPLVPGEYYNLTFNANGHLSTSRTIHMKEASKMSLIKIELALDSNHKNENSVNAIPVAIGIDRNKSKKENVVSKPETRQPTNIEKRSSINLKQENKRIESLPNEVIKPEPAFAIQIAAISKNVKSSKFSNLKDLGSLYTMFDSRIYKVRCGLYSSRDIAEKMLAEIQRRGYASAFIVEEKPSDMMDLVMLDLGDSGNPKILVNPIESSKSYSASKPKNKDHSTFTVRLATYNNPKWFDSSKLVGKEFGEIEILVDNGKSIYLLTGFETKSEAVKALELARSVGFKDAILVIN